jgi:hypothetical protein
LLSGSTDGGAAPAIVETVALVACATVKQSTAVFTHIVYIQSRCYQSAHVLCAYEPTLQTHGYVIATLWRPRKRKTLR